MGRESSYDTGEHTFSSYLPGATNFLRRQDAVSTIPTADSYALASHVSQPSTAREPGLPATNTNPDPKRQEGFVPVDPTDGRVATGGASSSVSGARDGGADPGTEEVDFFNSLGTEVRGAAAREQKAKERKEVEDQVRHCLPASWEMSPVEC